MAQRSRDRSGEVLDGLDTLVRAGRVAEVEELLTTLIDGGDGDGSPEERETRSYAQGMRDGISLARAASENPS